MTESPWSGLSHTPQPLTLSQASSHGLGPIISVAALASSGSQAEAAHKKLFISLLVLRCCVCVVISSL